MLEESLEQVIEELKFLHNELGLSTKEDIVIALCRIRDNLIERHNIIEMKAAYAKENLKDTQVCIYVKNSDANNFIIIDKKYVSGESTFKLKNGELEVSSKITLRFNYYFLPSAPTEDLAWVDAYNKLCKR